MNFATIQFIAFFAAVYAVYRLLPLGAWQMRKVWLLLASFAFYASWNAAFTLLLLYSICFDFGVALWLPVASRRLRPFLLVFSLLGNLGVLVFFKYGGFLYANATTAHLLPLEPSVAAFFHNLILPLGISFYTFHSLSYIIDVYRGARTPCREFVDYALYVSFFPQLMAGPILRAWEFLPQLQRPTHFDGERFAAGFARFGVGLTKKVLFADVLASYVDPVFGDPAAYAPLTAILALYAYAFQIYFDFSGYSDMALGLADMLGLKLIENFNWPYLATSITDFWRRWHMSLSRWLRDYLYIPLGGSRHGRWATYRNLMITMLLGGLWHGAGWNFVLWGGIHGGLLAFERAVGLREVPATRATRVLRIAVTFHLVLIAWFFFRIEGISAARAYLQALQGEWVMPAGSDWQVIGFVAVGYLLHAADGIWQLRQRFERAPAVVQGAAVAAIVILMINLSGQHQPFVYFQF